jgi:hypothetical protein
MIHPRVLSTTEHHLTREKPLTSAFRATGSTSTPMRAVFDELLLESGVDPRLPDLGARPWPGQGAAIRQVLAVPPDQWLDQALAHLVVRVVAAVTKLAPGWHTYERTGTQSGRSGSPGTGSSQLSLNLTQTRRMTRHDQSPIHLCLTPAGAAPQSRSWYLEPSTNPPRRTWWNTALSLALRNARISATEDRADGSSSSAS